MSNPCFNGSTCADNGAYDNYTCTCPDGFHGERCQVSSFYKIGCFNYKKRVIPELLQDLSGQLNFDNTEPAVLKCAELAQERGYRFFALGPNGKCYSGPKADEQYFRYGSASKVKCVNGAGKSGATFIYTFDPLPNYEKLGCFKSEKSRRHQAFRIKYMDFLNQSDSKDTKTTVERCLRVAIAKGFKYFAVRNRAQCWSDQNAAANYNKYGPSSDCKDGVGLAREKAFVVYKIKE